MGRRIRWFAPEDAGVMMTALLLGCIDRTSVSSKPGGDGALRCEEQAAKNDGQVEELHGSLVCFRETSTFGSLQATGDARYGP